MAGTSYSSFGNEEYTVGWICALPLELTAARGMLDEEHGLPREAPDLADKNTYVLGSIGQFKIVIACLPLIRDGSISMGVIANRMLFTFPNIRVGLLVGIGEGIPDHEKNRDIRLGDVVIGSDDETGGVVTHDFGKEIDRGLFYAIPALNRPPEALSSALMKMKSAHDMQENKVAEYIEEMLDKYPRLRKNGYCYPGPSFDRLFQSDYPHQGNSCKQCDPDKLVGRQDRLGELFSVHYGIIASGSMVVKDSIMREKIRAKYQAICLERGAAELVHGFPCMVIRGIWDYADSHNNDRWKPCAAAAAAACAKELLSHLQPRVVDGEPTMKDLLSRVHNGVKDISEAVTAQRMQKILHWITPLHYEQQQNEIIKQAQTGTGSWFLKSEEFTGWLNQSQGTLFCPGILGSGKTVMSSIVIEHLKETFRDDIEVQIAYVFCKYKPEFPQSYLDILLSILKQLSVTNRSLLSTTEEFYKMHSQNLVRPNRDEIRAQILKTALTYKKVFILVDALDEYISYNPEELKALLTVIFELQREAPINFFATSRFISEITDCFRGCTLKEIRADEEDISRYVSQRIQSLVRSTISSYPDTQENVRCHLAKTADGIFLLVRLHMDQLMGYPSIGELEDALLELPQGRNALKYVYDQAIQRIESLPDPCARMAIKTLSWLAYSKRDLTPEELQHALGTRPGMKRFNHKFVPALQTIDSLCAGLVIYDREKGTIRLIHHTAQEYLMQHRVLSNAGLEILTTMTTYLSFEDFSGGRCKNGEEFLKRRKEYPLHQYCSMNWVTWAYPVNDFSRELLELITQFLEKEGNIHAASEAIMIDDGNPCETKNPDSLSRRMAGLRLSGSYGLNDLLGRHWSGDSNDDTRPKYYTEGNKSFNDATETDCLDTLRLWLKYRRMDANGLP